MANPEHIEHLKLDVDAWNDWRERNPGVQPDLVGADLSGADLSGADLSDARLMFANLCRADLTDAYLSGADLSRANLRGVDFSGVDFSGADFSGADLVLADLIEANLNGADFSGANLLQANLDRAKLDRAKLGMADLNGADLREARLNEANLSGANLSEADLSGAYLDGADLSGANLSKANLSGAHLDGADLSEADLSEADLSGASFHITRFRSTIFAWVDLCGVEELDTAIHEGPSTVNVNTVKLPEGKTRTIFLQGAGFSDTFIDYYSSLFTTAIQYASCFISYAHQDEALAQHLYKDLQDEGVRCWFAPHNMRIGDRIRSRIDQAIHLHERLLLLLSEHSLASSWVEAEVEAALEKEQRQKCDVLFPVRLDDEVMHTFQAWAATLRRMRYIGDFTKWTDPQAYQIAFKRLLDDLKKSDELAP